MPDDSGDLRDRFRRTDYRSAPLRPRPPLPTRETVPTRTPDQAVPGPLEDTVQTGSTGVAAQQTPDSRIEAVAQSDKMSASILALPHRPQTVLERPTMVPPPRKIFTDDEEVAAPASEFHAPVKTKSKRAKRRAAKAARTGSKLVVAIPLILFVLSGAGLAAWHFWPKQPAQEAIALPVQYTSESLGFQIYYPKDLPDGFRVAPQSFTFQDGALIFYIDTGDGKNIPVSEQAVPADKTVDDLVPAPSSAKVTDTEEIVFADGKSAFSKWNDKSLTSTVAGKTWLILNVTSISKDDAKVLTQSFKKLQR